MQQVDAGELVVPRPDLCPVCMSGAEFGHGGYYWRGVLTDGREAHGTPRVRVLRLTCKGCGKSFGMLPSFRGAVQAVFGGGHRRVRA